MEAKDECEKRTRDRLTSETPVRPGVTSQIPAQYRFPFITEKCFMSEQTIWAIALGLIVLDLLLFMVPIVPFLVAYVLLARPPWFKDFVDDLYQSR
jgi:hypothetical protein